MCCKIFVMLLGRLLIAFWTLWNIVQSASGHHSCEQFFFCLGKRFVDQIFYMAPDENVKWISIWEQRRPMNRVTLTNPPIRKKFIQELAHMLIIVLEPHTLSYFKGHFFQKLRQNIFQELVVNETIRTWWKQVWYVSKNRDTILMDY